MRTVVTNENVNPYFPFWLELKLKDSKQHQAENVAEQLQYMGRVSYVSMVLTNGPGNKS